jgi:thioester reductase-like protein
LAGKDGSKHRPDGGPVPIGMPGRHPTPLTEARRDSGAVLLTGATGFLGMEVLARYLAGTDRRIYALVRSDTRQQAVSRLQGVMCSMFGSEHPYRGRVVAVRGDVTSRGFGLAARADQLSEQVSEIVHVAANVSFDIGLGAARASNVHGTQRVLEFAQRCQRRTRFRRLCHISTAYVAGDHRGSFSEDDLDAGQGFHNAYEQSKFEAEGLLARWRSRLPITVLRPGIIVGERDSGWTASFNVLYWPIRAYSRGAYRVLPARRESPVDVVPVDYVADAVFALAQMDETEDSTIHLTAGRHASSVGELIDLTAAFFGSAPPRVLEPAVYHRLVHPLLRTVIRDRRRRAVLTRSKVFFPYFAADVRYDDRRARAMLGGTGIAPSPLSSYFERLLRFALACSWGERTVSRAEAQAYARSTADRSGATAGADTSPELAAW